jgi:hypothetical protein
MRTCLCTLFVQLTPLLFAQQRVPEIPFDSVPDFPKLPDGLNFGEVPGVAVNSSGHVFVFTRSNTAGGPAYAPAAGQLLEFGAGGEFLREVGKGLYAWAEAHTVRIDKDDNIWAIDKGSDMVIKFNPAGRVMMVFGRRSESADGAKPWERIDPPRVPVDGLFRQPTDVAWDSEGNIYITDGYINSRVAKFDKNGDWVKSWGEYGTKPGQFRIPHAIVIDRNNNIYVGDRTNRRIQIFDTDGKFLRMFTIDVPPAPGSKPVNATLLQETTWRRLLGPPIRFASHPVPTRCCSWGRAPFPAGSSKCRSTARCLASLGALAGSLSSSPESTNSPALRRTKCTQPRLPIGASRS